MSHGKNDKSYNIGINACVVYISSIDASYFLIKTEVFLNIKLSLSSL